MKIQFLFLLMAVVALFACNNTPENPETLPDGEVPAAVMVKDDTANNASRLSASADTVQEPVDNAISGTRVSGASTESDVSKEKNKSSIAPISKGVPEQTVPAGMPPPEASVPQAPAAKTAPKTTQENETATAAQPPSHEVWDKLLQQYVSASGKVNYSGFKKDKARLESYLQVLAKNPPENDWSRAEKMAYWINAYNAFTVKLILDNYPLSSITNLDNGKPWDVKRIQLGGKNYSLNNIENDILRPQFKDARIHFAVNCAAISCPPLLNRAWTAANLESNFEKQAKAFINNTSFNKITAKEVEVSKIFDWYSADFSNLIEFLNRYASVKINANAKVKFKEYDWALNE